MNGDSDVNLGDDLQIRADIDPLPFGAKPQRLEVAQLRPTSPIQVVRQGFGGWKAAMTLRRSFLGFIESYGNTQVVGLLDALSFNVTGDLGRDFQEKLRRSGTIHIVSASGLHVTIISVALAALLLSVPIPRSAQLVAMSLLLVLYAAASGFHPPMVRAVTMVLVGSFAYAFRREPDGLSALSLAGVANLLMEPEAVASLGFQLSYLAVGFLILFGFVQPETDTFVARAKSNAVSLVRSSLVATIATAPILAYTFGEIPLVSALANFLVVPVILFVVVGSLSAWTLAFILPVAVGILKVVVEPLAGWIMAVVNTTGAWDWTVMRVPSFSPYWLPIIYVLMALLYSAKQRPADS